MTTDANVDQKDALLSGQPSEDKQEPSASLEVLKDQVDKAADKRHSKLDRQIGTLTKRAEDAEARSVQLQREKDETELEAVQGDPKALSVIQRERKIRAEKADIERREAQVKPIEERATEFERKELAQEVATQYGVDASLLTEHTDGSKEKMESLAKVLAQSTPSPKVREDLKPDSAISAGGGTMPESAKDKIKAGWDEIHKT